jgi:hypothetical protein
MQNINVTTTGGNPLLTYSTAPTGAPWATPQMVGGVWADQLNTGTYYFSLTVTDHGGTQETATITLDGGAPRKLSFSVPAGVATNHANVLWTTDVA